MNVNSTADPGTGGCDTTECTLREAITAANTASGADTIQFSTSGTISPLSPLPDINDGVTIEALPVPSGTTPAVITLDGVSAGAGANGLNLAAGSGGSTIRGLAIDNFSSNGIHVSSNGNTIVSNYLGTGSSGNSTGVGNKGAGIALDGDVSNNVIGGSSAATDGNVIGGNGPPLPTSGGGGIFKTSGFGTNNRVEGNYVGVDRSGSALGNTSWGIVNGGGLVIGTAAATPYPNVIGSNGYDGIDTVAGTVSNNYVGALPNGTARPNGMSTGANGGGGGIQIFSVGGGSVNVSSNTIASNNGPGAYVDANAGFNSVNAVNFVDNVVRGNAGAGVEVGSGNTGVRVSGGSFSGNGGLGIDLGTDSSDPPNGDGVTTNDAGDNDSGPNGWQNFPVITGAQASGSSTRITGTLNSTPNTSFDLQFYANQSCDSSGNGEGTTFLGEPSTGKATVVTNGSGDGTFDITLPRALPTGAQLVTATATSPDGSTSEFSSCAQATAPPPPSFTGLTGFGCWYAWEGISPVQYVTAWFSPRTGLQPGDFMATTAWSDGQLAASTQRATQGGSEPANAFETVVTRNFREEGIYNETTTVHGLDGKTGAFSQCYVVSDHPIYGIHGGLGSTPVNTSWTGIVGCFYDGDAYASPTAYSVRIDWGDGTSSGGVVSRNGPHSGWVGYCKWVVNGTHKYKRAGLYNIDTTITDDPSVTQAGVRAFDVLKKGKGARVTQAHAIAGQTGTHGNLSKLPKLPPLPPPTRVGAYSVKAPPHPTLLVSPHRVRAGRRVTLRFTGKIGQLPLAGLLIRFAGKSYVTDLRGRLKVNTRFRRAGRYQATIYDGPLGRARAIVRVRPHRKQRRSPT